MPTMTLQTNITREVSSYSVSLQVPSPIQGKNVSKLITLKGSFGTSFINFVNEGAPIQQSQQRPGENVFDVYYTEKDYDAFLDILRNEAPVYFTYWGAETGNFSMITTDPEATGEGE